MFEFTVADVFDFGNFQILVGKANDPLYDGKIKCDDIELEVKPVWGNREEIKDNLSFQVWKGKADKSLVGKTFKGVA